MKYIIEKNSQSISMSALLNFVVVVFKESYFICQPRLGVFLGETPL